ncbi:hypothetical protein N566_04365, partial [Streptomycetaceae bacterium MP113-05]
RSTSGAPTSLTYLQAAEALRHLRRSAERQRRLRAIEGGADVPPAAAHATPVLPMAARPAPRPPLGGFDFFGATKAKASERASNTAPRRNVAAADDPEPEPVPRRRPANGAAGNVVDLDADEGDLTGIADGGSRGSGTASAGALDIAELRGAIS